MSWSIAFIGKPDKVAEAIEAEANKLTGASKDEYESAKPHLIALVKQNFVRHNGSHEAMLHVKANGSGSSTTDGPIERSCQVSIQSIYGVLV